MTRTHFKLTALLVLLITALPVWSQVVTQGQLEKVKGKVSLVRGQAAPVLLHDNDAVQSGDEILTDKKSSATLRIPDGSTVRIYPNSHVVLRPGSGTLKEFLNLLLGNVRVQIEKLSGRPNPKSMTTPTAIIAVRGTIFHVAVDQNGDTQVGVEKGLVGVANLAHPEDEVMVKPGHMVWVRRGQRPTQPQMMNQMNPGMMGSGMSGMPGIGMPGNSGTMGTRSGSTMGGMGPKH
ncbi:MAG TPA: FecR domain-containing protein [Terriglobales bacterium]|nr:FecR domain-containing protein [Terriglobales bacterium]